VKVSFKKIPNDPRGKLPTKGSAGAAGLDLYTIETRTLRPGMAHMFSTGIIVEIPNGHEGQVRSRSGLAAKHGIHVLNSPGTIDEDYRGEIKVILHNTSNTAYAITEGDRVAQLVIKPVLDVEAEWVRKVTKTERGAGGFGSTGD